MCAYHILRAQRNKTHARVKGQGYAGHKILLVREYPRTAVQLQSLEEQLPLFLVGQLEELLHSHARVDYLEVHVIQDKLVGQEPGNAVSLEVQGCVMRDKVGILCFASINVDPASKRLAAGKARASASTGDR